MHNARRGPIVRAIWHGICNPWRLDHLWRSQGRLLLTRASRTSQRQHINGRGGNMNQQLIAITGGSGLIGMELVKKFAGSYRVIVFDVQEPDEQLPAGCEFVHLDLTSDISVEKGVRQVRERHGTRWASLIHLAAYYDFSGEPSPLYEEINVRGTRRLLWAARPLDVEQFIYSSTMLVHAPCLPDQSIDEDWPLEPKWDYPKSKTAAEALIQQERGKMPAVILRIAGAYDERCHSVPLAHQIQRIYERQLTSQVYPGDPERGQAFVHLDDVVQAIARAVERRASLPPETLLLIGEPDTVGYGELQREFGRLIHGEEWQTHQIPKALAKTGAWVQDKLPIGEEPFIKPWMIDLADDHYALDIERARTTLGWTPRHSLRETLPRMIDTLKANPRCWYEENKLDPSALPEDHGK
jgi:nucleoside-diphosphate-sugar epimerase